MQINWKGISAAAVSVFGVVSSPAVLGLLPPQYAAVVIGAGIIAQAFTHKAIQATPQSAPPTPPTTSG